MAAWLRIGKLIVGVSPVWNSIVGQPTNRGTLEKEGRSEGENHMQYY